MASYQLIKQIGVGDEKGGGKVVEDSVINMEGCGGNVVVVDHSGITSKLNSSCSSRSRSDCITVNNTSHSSSSRLVSLDVFRGLTVLLMILVDDAGGIIPAINHSPWNGLTLADYVMPFFLFMVGVSLALVYKNVSCKVAASRKALYRAAKLLLLGVFLQGGYFHGVNKLTFGVDLDQIRWMGILQRIAAAYIVAAICEIWLRNDEKVKTGSSLLKKYQWHWVVMSMFTAMYLFLLYGLYVPDWEYQIPSEASYPEANLLTMKVKCGVRGATGPACNAAGMIDRTILGLQHLYRKPIYARTEHCSINSPDYGPLPPGAPSWCRAPFDPEGILSTVMAVVTSLIGLQYGHIIVHFKDHKNRLLMWLVPSSGFMLFGMLCDIFGMHINKALYSVSYTCVTTGVAGLLFAAIYLVVDIYEYRRFITVVEWIGKNSLLIFILVACNMVPIILQGFYWKEPSNNFLSLIGVGKHKG